MNTKSKHTPGPWLYVSGQVERQDGACIAKMDRTTAATEAGIYPTERDANARLIAAAPEMLEALADVLHGLRVGYFRDTNFETHNNYADSIERMLAKARGES